MYKHHEESLKILKNHFQKKPEVIAIIFGGSVAKGCERIDSDLDAMVVITEDAYNERQRTNTTTESIHDMCTYKEGYFDIKYMTKQFLQEAAKKGSEPARNAFLGSKVIYTIDESIKEIVACIPIFQDSEYEDKMLSFYSNFSLNYDYFWKSCNIEGYMQIHVINEIIYSIYRMILQENHTLFPCHRRLEKSIKNLANKPSNIVSLATTFIEKRENSSCEAFVNAFLNWTSYQPPADYSEILTRYVADYEQWWRIPRPLIEEW